MSTKRDSSSATITPAMEQLARDLWPGVQTARAIQNKLRVGEAVAVLSGVPGLEWLLSEDGTFKETLLAELGFFCDADMHRLAVELCRWQPNSRDGVRWLRALRKGLPRADEHKLAARIRRLLSDYRRWHDGGDAAMVRRVLEVIGSELDEPEN